MSDPPFPQNPAFWGGLPLLTCFVESFSLSAIGFRDKSKENGKDGTYFHGIFPITTPPPPLLVNTPRPIFLFSRISPNLVPRPERWVVPTEHTQAWCERELHWI